MFCLDIETSGLDPEKNFITCIGTSSEDGIHQFSAPSKAFREHPQKAERELLDAFFKWVAAWHTPTVLTYNGISFDFPFIIKRAKLHSLTVPKSFIDAKIIDVILFSKQLTGRLISKDETIRKYSDIYVPRNSSGAYMARLYHFGKVTEDEHLTMLQHNSLDICATIRFVIVLREYPDFKKFMEDSLNATHSW